MYRGEYKLCLDFGWVRLQMGTEMRYFAQFLLFVCVLAPAGWAETREWSCPAGKFKVEGEAIAFNDDMVVLKKTSNTHTNNKN